MTEHCGTCIHWEQTQKLMSAGRCDIKRRIDAVGGGSERLIVGEDFGCVDHSPELDTAAAVKTLRQIIGAYLTPTSLAEKKAMRAVETLERAGRG